MFETPILFLIYKRPDLTRKVFDVIRTIKPAKLYIAADGPRAENDNEIKLCLEARQVISDIDWQCEVNTLFREKNLGCKIAVSKAIDWFFANEDKGIILEDDCLPHLDFFYFCATMLEHYQSNMRIFTITGNNFQKFSNNTNQYYLSKYPHCWGWATWRRAWNWYSSDISFWPKMRVSKDWRSFMQESVERKYWTKIFDKVYRGKYDSWAYPWTASVWHRGGLTITPNVNLVTNIGFDNRATHTLNHNGVLEVPSYSMNTITFHDCTEVNVKADNYVFNTVFNGQQLRFPAILYYLPLKLIRYIKRKIII